VVVSRERNPDSILIAMRSGARDFAYLDDDSQDVRRALLDLGLSAGSAPGGRGKLITIFSSKGGSGATAIACNLAGDLAQLEVDGRPARVVLLDFDLEMGDVLVFLDMTARFSYQELLANMHRLDWDLIDTSLAKHSAGFHVISQTDYVEEGRELGTADATSVLGFLRTHFDFVVIDGMRDFRETNLAALDRADTMLLVMTQDIPALKNASRCLRIFKRLGYEGDRVQLVLNRFRGAGQLTPASISDALGHKVKWTVANDFPSVIKAVNEGKLLVQSAAATAVAKDIQSIAASFQRGDAPVKRRGLFGMWGKK